jgi:YHS domain-containing protein
MINRTLFFLLAVGVSLLAASYRWNDSAHAIGVIKENGGEARHPVTLESSRDNYMLIATATVIPPYRGDVDVVLEGEPRIAYTIHASGPIIDLGLHRFPRFEDNTLLGLKPRDKVALWVEMKLPEVDPVCGMAVVSRETRYSYKGTEYHFCSNYCLTTFMKEAERYKDRDRAHGTYVLAFYDYATKRKVLSIPLIFKNKGEANNEDQHHH